MSPLQQPLEGAFFLPEVDSFPQEIQGVSEAISEPDSISVSLV